MKESSLQLIGKPKVKKVLFETNSDFQFSADIKLDIDTHVQVMRSCVPDECHAQVVLNLSIFKKIVKEEAPFQIEVEIEGLFNWSEEAEENPEFINRVLKQNAAAVLYSYIRPLITNLTVEANMPPLVIPLMNFHKS